MSQVVAFEFDRQGVRAAVADEADARVSRIAQVDRADIETGEQLADALRSALPDVRWQRATLVAVLAGEQLRCRLLKLPPCPDGELPDMVRMQAVREFALTEHDAVDYVPLTFDAAETRSVLAATVESDDLEMCKAAARALDANLARAVARGSSAAELMTKLDPSLAGGAHLIAVAAPESVDLVLLENGAPSLLRSARAPGDAASQAVVSEARRTAAMAAQQTGRRVDSTHLVGFQAPPGKPDLTELDAVGYLEQHHGLAAEEGVAASKLVGVAAAAISAAQESSPTFDFLHPRRPVVDNSGRRRQVLLAIAAASVVVLGLGFDYSRAWKLKQEISARQDELREKKNGIEEWAPIREKAAAIDNWLETDVNWLDELERLGRQIRPAPLKTEDFPADTDAHLTQFTATRATQRDQTGGTIDLRAVSRSRYSYDEIEQRLRDDRHQVETTQGTLTAGGGAYDWETQTSLRVEKPTEEELP